MIICSVAKGHTTQGFPKIDNDGETWDVGTLDVASEVDRIIKYTMKLSIEESPLMDPNGIIV